MPVDYAEKCAVCGHPTAEQPRTWGCGYCCPAHAPEVPSREPGKYWRAGIFHPAGNADVVRTVPRRPTGTAEDPLVFGTLIEVAGPVHPNGRGSH